MFWRALEWTEMKSLMNLKAFRTLNRYHISKIHENSSDWNLVTTVRARTILGLENANKFLDKLSYTSKWSRAVVTKISPDFIASALGLARTTWSPTFSLWKPHTLCTFECKFNFKTRWSKVTWTSTKKRKIKWVFDVTWPHLKKLVDLVNRLRLGNH